MNKRLERLVRQRAHSACEYCRAHTFAYEQPFHIDHIISRKHGGLTTESNLAFACLDCNAYKGTDISGIDAQTAALTRLFNPRLDQWREHFRWNGPVLTGLTPIGRATVVVLRINLPIRVRARAILIEEGVFLSSE